MGTPPDTTTLATIKNKQLHKYTRRLSQTTCKQSRNKVLDRTPPEIRKTERSLRHYPRKLLAQIRTNKSPFLHKITPETHTTPNCPLCHSHTHTRRYTHLWLRKGALSPGPWGAKGRSWGGGGAAGLLVGPAGGGAWNGCEGSHFGASTGFRIQQKLQPAGGTK